MDHENHENAAFYQNAMQEAMDRRDNGGANGQPRPLAHGETEV